jgi:hypothetical protein
MRIVAVLTILCLTGLTTGCATERVVTVYEPVEVYRDRFVEVPDNLTEPVEIIELPDNGGFRNADTLQLGAAFKAQRVRAEQCNGQLAEIARLNDEQEKE